MKLLENKNILILGLANERSIAWGIAKEFKEYGANLAFNYLGEALKKRVEPLAQQLSADFIFDLDVTDEAQMSEMSKTIKQKWNHIDVIVHSLAFANKEDLKNSFIETTRAGFLKALEISSYSLIEVARNLKPLLRENSSLITMTYHGSTQVIPGYNVMGVAKAALETSVLYLANDLGTSNIRVNAISAGPIKTLAASGVGGFREKLKYSENKAALKKNISQKDIAGTAVYLASHLSSGVTGEIIYVDNGLSIIGV